MNASVKDKSNRGLKYDGKDVQDFESTIDENLACWIKYVEKNGLSVPGTTKEFDIARSAQWLMFELVCRLCFGYAVGFVEKHEDCYHFQKTLEERLPIVEKFAVLTEMNTWIKFISYLPLVRRVLPSPQDKDGIGAILKVQSFIAFRPHHTLDHSI